MRSRQKSGLEAEVQRQRKSRMRTRIVACFLFLLSVMSLIINFLCLFSGNERPYTWNSSMVSMNATSLGSDLPSANSSHLATELGLQQWYSFSVLSVCEGSYSPLAFAPGAESVVNSCIFRTPFHRFEFTTHLQQELQIGTLNATLADLHWPAGMQTGLDATTGYLEATLILRIFSIIFLLSTIIPSAMMLFRTSVYANLAPKLCLLTSIIICLAFSSAVTSAAYSHKTAAVFNTLGNTIGISASVGHRFNLISWTNVALSTLTFLIWAFETYTKTVEDRRQRMILHQEHYERARMWGKIGALEGEEPMCSCVDPWKVMGHRRGDGDCGGKGMPRPGRIVGGGEGWEGGDREDTWRGVEEKVLVMGR